jgi:hypothetical protein
MRIQRVGDNLVGRTVISDAMKDNYHPAIPGRAGRPVAIEQPSLVDGCDVSVPVGNLARKMGYIFGASDLGRHYRLYLSGIKHYGITNGG